MTCDPVAGSENQVGQDYQHAERTDQYAAVLRLHVAGPIASDPPRLRRLRGDGECPATVSFN